MKNKLKQLIHIGKPNNLSNCDLSQETNNKEPNNEWTRSSRKSKILKSNLFFALMASGFINVYASNAQPVSLHIENAPLKTVFKNLEKQTGYNFFYKESDIQHVKNLNIDLDNSTLNNALDVTITKYGLSYEIVDKTIVIKRSSNTITNQAQESIVIFGKILHDDSGKPVANASITANTGEKTTSNNAGTFQLKVSKNTKNIKISSIGFVTQNIKVSENVVVRLKQQDEKIEEVVVNTGVFKKVDKSFTGSSTTVTREQLMTYGDRNLITSLRNIDPSFNIIESNSFGSDPNRMPEIQIRGNSSIPNVNEIRSEADVALNTPLVILDGFQTNLQKLLDMNENDVESITILKDASATALYGSRGANGVIVITTRTPAAGKLRVNLSTNWSLENPDLSDYSLINSRNKLELERLAGYYDNARAETDLTLKQYYNYILNEVNRGVETDWKSIPLRTSVGQRHNISLEGGDSKFRYSASLQNNNIQGVMKGSSRNTINGGITLHYNYENLKFRNNTQIRNGNTANSPYGTFSDYTKLNSYWAPYDANGKVLKRLGDPGENFYSNYWNTGLPTNPLYNATLETYDKSEITDIINNTSVDWNVTKDLILRGQIGITKTNTQSDQFRPADHTEFANYDVDNLLRKGDYQFGNENYFGYDGAIDVIYSKTFAKKHQVFTAFNFNSRQAENIFTRYVVEGFPNANLDFPSMGLQYQKDSKPTGNESLTRAVGFTFNANYSYDDKYFFDGTFRKDGASQFGSANRFANFWSLGLGWNLHNESFMQELDFVDRFKLRGSLGTTGAQNFSAYQAMTTYNYTSGNRYFTWIGANPVGLGNENLKWQTTLKKNIGADIDLFKRRFMVKADYYIETTKDLVSSVNLPASNGFTSYTENIGRLENKGAEITLTGVLFNNPQAFSWTLSTALVHNANKVIETSQALKDAQKAIQNGTSDPGTMYVEGYSSRTIWVVPSLGIDPSTGKELYLGKDGEPTYTWKSSDVAAVGSEEADLFGNINTTVRYKNLSMTASFRYEFGGQSYNSTLRDKVETTSYKYNVDARVYDSRWKEPGDMAAFKGLLVTSPTYKTSRFVQDNNSLVLSNLQFQYQMHKERWMKNWGVESFVFTANTADPLYFSSIRRERGTSYPFARRFSLALRATF